MYYIIKLYCFFFFLPQLQSLSAQWLSRLLGLCKDRSPSPNSKIVKNLASFACCDPKYTPSIRPDTAPESDSQASKAAQTPSTPTEEPSKAEAWEWNIGIITLVRLQKQVHACVWTTILYMYMYVGAI